MESKIQLATQYYRPPFPEKRFWKDDFKRIKDSGLDAVQLWMVWGWIEHKPGAYQFDDYDALFDLAGKNDLRVIISTIAEIHPFWIHRIEAGSNMVSHHGRVLRSRLRSECNVGLAPGGCTDHPGVRKRMGLFLEAVAARYAGHEALIAWDCWNETRWNICADTYVCYCPNTITSYRQWLQEKYGSLESLNEAWKRKYCSWDDVYPDSPGCLRPYTDGMEFGRFLQWRASEHMRFRYTALHGQDPDHPIGAHSGFPSIISRVLSGEQCLSRGNDWDHAEHLDAFGCSHFPFGARSYGEAGYGYRIEATRSVCNGKPMWISEFQGGAANVMHGVNPPVEPAKQQRWLWDGFGRGAKAVIFWCWRDEVFGLESSGYGLAGMDGYADKRLRALKDMASVLNRHRKLLAEYQPDSGRVGVWFDPDNYQLSWVQHETADPAAASIDGYAEALERLHIPYEVIESNHRHIPQDLKLLFMPWALIVKPEAREELLKFVREGGNILCEAETDAFTALGFFRYPGNDRPFMAEFGISHAGRRLPNPDTIAFDMGSQKGTLKVDNWLTPLICEGAEVLGSGEDGQALLIRKSYGKGAVYVLGTTAGNLYAAERYAGFENFVNALAKESGVEPDVAVTCHDHQDALYWRAGHSQGRRMLFLHNKGEAVEFNVKFTDGISGSEVMELISDRKIGVESDTGQFSDRIAARGTNVYLI
jgi:beta-galactosidase